MSRGLAAGPQPELQPEALLTVPQSPSQPPYACGLTSHVLGLMNLCQEFYVHSNLI